MTNEITYSRHAIGGNKLTYTDGVRDGIAEGKKTTSIQSLQRKRSYQLVYFLYRRNRVANLDRTYCQIV